MSSNEKLEREFAAFLSEEDSRLAALYRKLPQTEPDPRLDATVRAMAQRALNPGLGATPRATSTRLRLGRWLPALGAAAGLVLAAGIAFRLGPSWHGERGQTGAPANDVISVRPIEAPPAAAPPLSPSSPPRQAESEGTSPTPAVPAAPSKLQSQAAAEEPKPAAPATVRANAAKLQHSAANRPAADAAGALGTAAEKPEAAGGPQPQAFPPPAQVRVPEIDAVERKEIMATGAWQNLHDHDAAAAEKKPAQPPIDDKEAAVHAKAAEPARQDELRSVTPALGPAAATPRPAASSATVEQSSAPPPTAGTVAPAAALDADARPDLSREERAAPGLSDKSAQQQNGKVRSRDPNASVYPEHWLQNIRTMLRDGNRDDALRSLTEFRRMYPDYQLPDDLRDLR
jgi:hypothetical protein